MKHQWIARLTVVGSIGGCALLMNFNPAIAVAQKLNCQKPITQLEMNQCANINAKAADRKLNQVYQQVRTKYQGTEQRKLLSDAEEAWIKFRDTSCTFSKSRVAGGSIAPLVYSNCLTNLTKQRTQTLESYLQEGNF